MAVQISISQTCFRFRNDDGSETTATWLAALNTNVTVGVGTKLRLRFGSLDSSGATEVNTSLRCFRWSNNGGSTFNVVTSSTAAIQLASSTHVSDLTATTQQITTGGTFAAGDVLTSTTNTNSDGTGKTIEDEACIVCNTAGTYIVQMADWASGVGSAYGGGYAVTCTLTVTAASTRRRAVSYFF